MEKEGLNRVMKFLEEKGLQLDVLVSDKHLQIQKWMREEHPEVDHYLDIWHVAKGIINNCKCILHCGHFGLDSAPYNYTQLGCVDEAI